MKLCGLSKLLSQEYLILTFSTSIDNAANIIQNVAKQLKVSIILDQFEIFLTLKASNRTC